MSRPSHFMFATDLDNPHAAKGSRQLRKSTFTIGFFHSLFSFFVSSLESTYTVSRTKHNGNVQLLHLTFLRAFTTSLVTLSWLQGSVTFATNLHILDKQQHPT